MLHIADLVAVGSLARRHGDLPAVVGHAAASYPPESPGIAPVMAAAFEAATAGHWLDWDDVLVTGAVHPGVVILPSLAAVSRIRPMTVLQAAEMFIVGVARTQEVAAAFAPDHAARGWHPTATIGRIAAAEVAAMHLDSGDRGMHWRAGRIAAGSASGFTDAFGSSLKPLQVGAAAASAASAAMLAASVTDVPDVLAPGSRLASLLGLNAPVTEPSPQISAVAIDAACAALRVKQFPICFYAHPVILAAEQLFAESSSSGAISDLLIRVSPECARTCDVTMPSTLDEVRFSLPTLVSALQRPSTDGLLGLLDGSILMTDSITSSAAKIHLEVDSNCGPFMAEVDSGHSAVTVDLGAGTEIDLEVTRSAVLRKAQLVGGEVGISIERLALGDPEEATRPLSDVFDSPKE